MARLDWTREEVILAMDLYFTGGSAGGGAVPGPESQQVKDLSDGLRTLSAYPAAVQGTKYRNPSGVGLKLLNLRAIETDGKHGMNAYSQMDAAVWRDFADDIPRLHAEAAAIRARMGTTALAPAASAPSVHDVAIEKQNTEEYLLTPSGKTTTAVRAEQKLVIRYRDYMASKGVDVQRRRYVPAGEVRPLYSDVWVPDRDALIEAKNSDSRESLRMAIGQLCDYSRFHDPGVRCAVLMPYKPNADRLDLLSHAGVDAIWPYSDRFRDSASGYFV
jgi:hypothetical protein